MGIALPLLCKQRVLRLLASEFRTSIFDAFTKKILENLLRWPATMAGSDFTLGHRIAVPPFFKLGDANQ